METTENNTDLILTLQSELEFRKYELEIAKLKVQNAEMALKIANKNEPVKIESKKEYKADTSVLMKILSESYRIPLENENSIFKQPSEILNDLILKGKIDNTDNKFTSTSIGIYLNRLGFIRTQKRLSILKVRYGYEVIELNKKGGEACQN